VQTCHLIRGLQAEGIRNILVAQPGSEIANRTRDTNVEVIEVAMRGEWDVVAVLRLASVVRAKRPDALHLHTSHAHTLGLLAGRIAGARPIIATRRMDHEIRGIFSRCKYRATDHVVAISHVIQRLLVAGGVPSERVSVIHSAVGCADSAPQQDLRGALRLGHAGPVIGTVATLNERKGHRFLFEAVGILKRRHPGIRLLVAGTGPLESQLKALADQKGLRDEILFLGFRSDIPQLLNTLDIFVLASLKEGLGVSLLEAARSGLPLVATNVGGIPEIVRDGVTGRLVPPADSAAIADALDYMLQHPAEAAKLGKKARERITTDFSVAAMVARYRELYGRLIRQRDRGD
jgi:glycosyltransferase involved in cell wall biosynthesis